MIQTVQYSCIVNVNMYNFISLSLLDFKKFMKKIQKIKIHLKELDVLVYYSEDGDINKYNNVTFIYVKLIFPSHA